ncbi:MAG: regulatory protein RecX [Ignavibacteriales bacterium]|nr:MAG: regulatory protein RecX [Ignavibacteriales bacterium]
MKIIELSKKNDNDVSIIFDTGEQLFLSYEIVLKKGLRRGTEIDEDLYNLLIDDNRKFFVKQRASRFLSRRLHSVSELKLKLRKFNYETVHIQSVIFELVEHGYLDDKKFAEIFSDEKRKLKRWGDNKIKAELLKRGVKIEIINEVLSAGDSDEENFANAKVLAEKKLKSLQTRESDPRKISMKVMNYLIGRGFGYELVKQVVSEITKSDDTDL